MSGSTSGQPRVWSLWIYDRRCTLIYHADWSAFHNRTASAATGTVAAANNATASGSSVSADGAAATTGAGHGRSTVLPLAEQAKLVYGLVFSLRNMTRKLTPTAASSPHQQQDTLHSFSTATYTLAHLQTPTHYTFVMLTDPVPPPTRRAPTTSGTATFSGGGGIPATGGMTTTGVLAQITRGPWVEFVARNPGCLSLERQEYDEDDDEDDDDNDVGEVDTGADEVDAQSARETRRSERRLARHKEQQRQQLTGIGKSVDSEAFRAAIERVLTQNKLNATRI